MKKKIKPEIQIKYKRAFEALVNDGVEIKKIQKKYSLPFNKYLNQPENQIPDELHDEYRAFENWCEENDDRLYFDCFKLGKNAGLDFSWSFVLLKYIKYGVIDYKSENKSINLRGFKVKEVTQGNKSDWDELDDLPSDYPICLYISAKTTKEDLKNFISKYYEYYIEPLQRKHRNEDSLVGSVRYRSKNVATKKAMIIKLSKQGMNSAQIADAVEKKHKTRMTPNNVRTTLKRSKKV